MSSVPKSSVSSKARLLVRRGAAEVHYARKMFESRLLRIESPKVTAGIVHDFLRWGEMGSGLSIAARRVPDRTAIIDDLGSISYKELNDAANAFANGLLKQGVTSGDGVALLSRNHRGFMIVNFACARIGARTILLNTDFAGPQIREVAAREGAKLLVYDEEYERFLEGFEPPLGRIRCWTDEPGENTVASIVAANPSTEPPRPARHSSIVILTSGTTGTPKGAPREQPKSLAPIGGILSSVPFKAEEVTCVPAPMFHALGYLHASVAIGMGSTLIIRRQFDATKILADMEEHKATAVVVVPVMLSRLLDAHDELETKPDLSSLRIVFVSGSQLGSELAQRGMETLGPKLYNLYGSTEVAFATIATPEDLAIDPATVGRIVKGTRVELYDDNGNPVKQGEVGRIFVGNPIPFTGYTGGGGKQIINGLLSSGDVGHFDENGLLYVDGRDDEMIVSGGENVFPAEIEDLLTGHPEIVEATAVGVDDEKWGARLQAFVVKREDSELSEEDVCHYVRENLARYKVPREVFFIDTMPRNPSGKILKRKLKEISGAA